MTEIISLPPNDENDGNTEKYINAAFYQEVKRNRETKKNFLSVVALLVAFIILGLFM